MRKEETFITQAMLASYLEVEQKDYLELLLPFLCVCLPQKVNAKISLQDVKESLYNDYALDIPVNVIEKLLLRLRNRKDSAQIAKEKGTYIVKKCYDSSDFEQRTLEIRRCIDAVLSKMQKFFNTKKYISDITYEKLRNYLTVFLDTYNYSVYEDTESLNNVLLEKQSESNYYVAQFILSEYNNDSVEFRYILEIIKGSLIAKSIYYFMNAANDLSTKRIYGTKFILDTRVLLDALGLNLEQESVAAHELIDLIMSNGGQIVTYDYYVDELRGIIHRYAKSKEIRLALSLDYFVRKRYTSEEAIAYAETLDFRLAELGISIITKPNYADNIQQQTWHIDYEKLRSTLNSQIDYRLKSGDSIYSNALTRDADTIEAVAFDRGKPRCCSIFDCKTLFVTKNADICKVVYKLYKNERFGMGEINFAITDVDLTSIIWLSTFGVKSDLPKLKLLEHAYSACAPSSIIMNEFLNKLRSMEESEKISQEMAVLLRSQYATITDLSDLSHNKEGSVNDKTIREMEKRMCERYEEQAKEVYKKEFDDLDKTREEIELFQETVEKKREALVSEQRKTVKLKHDVEFFQNKVNQQRETLSVEKKTFKDSVEELQRVRDNLLAEAKKRASRNRRRIVIFSFILTTALLLSITGLFTYATWIILNNADTALFAATAFTSVVSVVCLIITVVSIIKFFSKPIHRLGERIYDLSYTKYMKKYAGLFQ